MKSLAEMEARLAKRWPAYPKVARVAIFLVTILVATWFYPVGDVFEYRYDLNEITSEAVIAPFNFPILKSENELNQERDLARQSVPFLFRRDTQITAIQLNSLIDLFARIRRIQQAESRLATSLDRAYRYRYEERYARERTRVERDSLALVDLQAAFAQRFPLDLNGEHWSIFFKGKVGEERIIDYDRLRAVLERIVRDILTEGVLDRPLGQLGSDPIALSSGGLEEPVELRFLMDLDEAWARAKTRLQAQYPAELTIEQAVASDLLIFLIRPNLIYDAETTERRRQEAVDRVPISKGIVLRNERIVDANTRVDEAILEKLNSLAVAKSRSIAGGGGIQFWLPIIGMLLINTSLLTFFFSWFYVYRRTLFRHNRILMLINIIFLAILAMAYIFHLRLGLSQYLIPFTVAAMTLTILFDARTSTIATVTLALMMGFLLGNKVDFALINIMAGAVSIYAVRQLRRRRQIFMAIIYIITAYALGITAVEFLRYTSIKDLGIQVMYASLNGLLAPIMVYGLIGMLEVVFGLTTNLTLLELSDFNHPLLRRLSREANGTFSHSIVVGNLAEAAANAIGANSLLCRVGAYYHDIGKLSRPEYFIENQFHRDNPHETIAPHLSAKVVIAHVKEGLRLAREYGLPKAVSDFIPMHHGTARIEYFYQKAVQENGGPDHVKEDDFRYIGPKPNTKETGILMLCEAIEAATRSIKEPTLPRIQQMMDTIIDMRVSDNQLDECPLTLEELNRIKGDAREGTGMISVLKGIYHVRIPYPTTDKERAEQPIQEEEALTAEQVFEGTPTE